MENQLLFLPMWHNVFYIQYLLLSMVSLAFSFELLLSTMWFASQTLLACWSELNSTRLHLSPYCILQIVHRMCSFLNTAFFSNAIWLIFVEGTTCVKPSSVQYNCYLKDHTSTDVLLCFRTNWARLIMKHKMNLEQMHLRCPPSPHSHIPTSLCFPIAEAIWSHPGVTVAPRGAAILAKWHSGLTTYNHSHFLYGTKESDFISIYLDELMTF